MKSSIRLEELKSPYYFEQTAFFAETLGINFKRSGRFYVASCPFHSDTKPSFYLHHAKGTVRFTCFSDKCKGSWDIFDLIQDIEKCDFIHALKHFGQFLTIDEIILPKGNIIKVRE
jgi:DNA primase